MKKLTIATLLIFLAVTAPVSAHTHNDRALGNMFTKALNAMSSHGLLDTLDPKKHVTITNIFMDHGQVFVVMSGDDGAVTMTYDPIANKVLHGSDEVK